MSTALTPRESGEFIVQNAKYLKVIPEGIIKISKEIIKGIKEKKIDATNFSQHNLHPKSTDAKAIEWIFVVDTLNFCFWTPNTDSGDGNKYKVDGYTGYFALCAAINRAIAEGVDMTNSEVYSNIDKDTLEHIFRSDDGVTKIPLLDKRVECLNQVGNRLKEKWQGKFENVVIAAKKSAKLLLQLIVTEFPCFCDEADYNGKRVALYKRAQILIGDIWACFEGKGFGSFDDLEHITMFADYRVPQVLVHFGSLQYEPQLLQALNKDEILENGDAREVEIRGASIYIVEQVKDAIRREIPNANINSILIDHFLWDYRRKYAQELEYIPFHKVLSLYY